MQQKSKRQTLHRTLFTTNYPTSHNQGHFNPKAFSIEKHNNIQAPFIAQQQESHNCCCACGAEPRAAPTGAPRGRRAAHPMHCNSSTPTSALGTAHTFPELPFCPTSLTSCPSFLPWQLQGSALVELRLPIQTSDVLPHKDAANTSSAALHTCRGPSSLPHMTVQAAQYD